MTVHSNDRQSWLTKLERISELSAKDKGIVFNNIGHLINADILKEQYERLPGNKAVGIDKETKLSYGENLEENINNLLLKIRRSTYKPKAARMTAIPKEDGSTRPLAISCFEDKLVQLIVSMILTRIYEPLFLPCSFGYRPGKNCHEALKALTQAMYKHPHGAIIEIDIQEYFNTIPHRVLMKLLRKKISDRRFLRLIQVLITAPIHEAGRNKANNKGCPQGSILSPILSNIFLHHVIDEWFESIKHTHLKGKATLIRFADDMVFAFEWQSEAKRFYEVLNKRLTKFALQLEPNKTRLVEFGRFAQRDAKKWNKKVETIYFLGFTHFCTRNRNGNFMVGRKTEKSRLKRNFDKLRKLMGDIRHYHPREQMQLINQVLRGIYNYYGLGGNHRALWAVYRHAEKYWYKMLKSRSRKSKMTWEKFKKLKGYYPLQLPKLKLTFYQMKTMAVL